VHRIAQALDVLGHDALLRGADGPLLAEVAQYRALGRVV
jgi:hypothetical protein